MATRTIRFVIRKATPAAGEPGTSAAAVIKPAVEESVVIKPAAEEPEATEPARDEPEASEPTAEEQDLDEYEPEAEESEANELPAEEPESHELTTEEPVLKTHGEQTFREVLGNKAELWQKVKEAHRLKSDRDVLATLIDFFVEAKGLDSPPPPAASPRTVSTPMTGWRSAVSAARGAAQRPTPRSTGSFLSRTPAALRRAARDAREAFKAGRRAGASASAASAATSASAAAAAAAAAAQSGSQQTAQPADQSPILLQTPSVGGGGDGASPSFIVIQRSADTGRDVAMYRRKQSKMQNDGKSDYLEKLTGWLNAEDWGTQEDDPVLQEEGEPNVPKVKFKFVAPCRGPGRPRIHPPRVPKFLRCTDNMDAETRALEGMLWREAVYNGQPMPVKDVRMLYDEAGFSQRPLKMPWASKPPIMEQQEEGQVLREMGCSLCDLVGFASRVDVVSHLWLQHPETRERYPTQLLSTACETHEYSHCALCFLTGTVFPGKNCVSLETHAAEAHGAVTEASELEPFTCDECLEECASQAELDAHVAGHVGRGVAVYTCAACGQAVEGTLVYIRHLRIHYVEHKIACSICPNFKTTDAETMRRHLATHDRRFLRCNACPLRTRTFRTLLDHVRSHLNMPRFVCPTCGYKAYSSSRYFEHLDKHGGRRHRCEICNAVFKSQRKKSHHKLLEHRKPKSFTCEHCGMIFISTARLQRHLNTHTGYKPFQCQLCGKGLASKQSLVMHARACKEVDYRPSGGV